LVVGAGGLGSNALLFLASAGVGKITIVDDDVVDLSNLQRQVLYRHDDLAQSKAHAAAKHVQMLNPHCDVHPLTLRISEDTILDAMDSVNLVLDCTDNFATRHIINKACFAGQRILVSASALQWQGQLVSFDFRQAKKEDANGSVGCYACIFPPSQHPIEANCASYGVFAPLVGMMGSLQAGEALKLITQSAEVEHGLLQLFDARSNTWTRMQTSAHPDCPVCATEKPNRIKI
jgi:molybdopterin/thiamine biosynthesis adenylyltransferase